MAESTINWHIRERLVAAVAALQEQDERAFDDAVLLVIDELATPNPAELVGHVLRNNRELTAFVRLSHSLERLVNAIGERGTFADAVRAGAPWQECRADAQNLLKLLLE